MSALHHVKRLFSLDTLDTRFTTSSRSPAPPSGREPQFGLSSQSSLNNKSHELQQQRRHGSDAISTSSSRSRWKTPEFMFYYAVFLLAIPLMFKSVYEVSNRKVPEPSVITVARNLLTVRRQHRTPTTPNSSIFSPKAGYRVEKSTALISNTPALGITFLTL